MAQRIVFTDVGQVGCEACETAELEVGEVRVRSRCSLISSGTESTVLHKRYSPGSHWDQWAQGKFPFYPGYACIGEVVECGADVTSHVIGDRVAFRETHASEHVIAADQAMVVPDGISDEQAAWFALAKIAFMATKVGDFGLGTAVAIIGAGPVGQMALRWALAAGVEPLVVIDPVADRCQIAAGAGRIHCISRIVEAGDEELRALCGGEMPAVVIDTTGNAAVFQTALGLVRRHGQVVILGDTGSPEAQCLSSDVMTKGLRIVAGHDCHEDATWSQERIVRLFFDLVVSGRFSVDGLISHRFTPADSPQAYALLEERRGDSMGLLIDWSQA